MEKITVRMIENICYEVASSKVADEIKRISVDEDNIKVEMADEQTNYYIGFSEDGKQTVETLSSTASILLLGEDSSVEDIKSYLDEMFGYYEDYLN